jgi:hypothetical protein
MRLPWVVAVALAAFAGPALAGPASAADPMETACLYAMAERLPKLPGLRILRTELSPWAPGLARAAPIGMQRKAIGGHIVTDLGGLEASYAVNCWLLIDRHGAVAVEAEHSSLRLENGARPPIS